MVARFSFQSAQYADLRERTTRSSFVHVLFQKKHTVNRLSLLTLKRNVQRCRYSSSAGNHAERNMNLLSCMLPYSRQRMLLQACRSNCMTYSTLTLLYIIQFGSFSRACTPALTIKIKRLDNSVQTMQVERKCFGAIVIQKLSAGTCLCIHGLKNLILRSQLWT